MQNTETFKDSFHRVQQSWLETRELWLDQTAQDFERDSWQPLVVEAQQLLKLISSLEVLLREKV